MRKLPNKGWCRTFKQVMAPDMTSDEQRPRQERYLRDVVSRNERGRKHCERLRTKWAPELFDNNRYENKIPDQNWKISMEHHWAWARRCAYVACQGPPPKKPPPPPPWSPPSRPHRPPDDPPSRPTKIPTLPRPTEAQNPFCELTLCNRTSDDVRIALSHLTAPFTNVRLVYGWKRIAPNACWTVPTVPRGSVLVHAQQRRGKRLYGLTEGQRAICVVEGRPFKRLRQRNYTCRPGEKLRRFKQYKCRKRRQRVNLTRNE